MGKTAATDAFFAGYCRHAGLADAGYAVAVPGDTPEMRAELVALIRAGTKRATASLLRDFQAAGEAVPRPGDHAVVVGPDGTPALIWRTSDVRIGPLESVDAAFAWDEGEGRRTHADWLAGHRRYFARQAAREGFVLDAATPVVFERFRLVWPPDLAD